jgi:hypothetical protein
VEGARSLIATSRLSRNTHISVTSLAIGARRVAFAFLNITDVLVSKILVL